MTRTSKESGRGPALLRGALLTFGLVLLSSGAIPRAEAQPCRAQVTTLARGPFLDQVDMRVRTRIDREVDSVQVRDAAWMWVQQITIQPGGFTDWHTHHGPAVVVVVQGVLTVYDGDDAMCSGRAYGPGPAVPGVSPPTGESFIDLGQGNVHNARNEGDEPVVVYVTYFDVPEGNTPLVVAPDYPNACGFGPRPTSCAFVP